MLALVALLLSVTMRAEKKAWVAYYGTTEEVTQVLPNDVHNYLVFSYGEDPAATYEGIALVESWSGDDVIDWKKDDPEATSPKWVEKYNAGSIEIDTNKKVVSITYGLITDVVFEPSFVVVRPTKTSYWFWSDNQKIHDSNYEKDWAFIGASNIRTITGLEYLNTSKVTTMQAMFTGTRQLQTLDVSTFDTSHVTSFRAMFRGGIAKEGILTGFENWDTSNMVSCGFMFEGCGLGGAIDLSRWDASKWDGTLSYMFPDTWYVTSIDMSSWDFSRCSNGNTNQMIGGYHESLENVALGVNYDTSKFSGLGINYEKTRANITSLSIPDVTSFLNNETNATSILTSFTNSDFELVVPSATPQEQVDKLKELLAAAGHEGKLSLSDDLPYYHSYQLTISDACLATLCLPYNVEVPDDDYFIPAIVTGVKAVTKTKDGKEIREYVATMKVIKDGVIPANTGVVIMGNPKTYTLSTTSKETTEDLSDNMLGGVNVRTAVSSLKNDPSDLYYVFAQGTLSPAGFKLSSAANCAANKSYMIVPANYFDDESAAKFIGLSFSFDDEEDGTATAIKMLESTMTSVAKTQDEDVYYNLSGQRVAAPTKGIYIKNGKKYLVK